MEEKDFIFYDWIRLGFTSLYCTEQTASVTPFGCTHCNAGILSCWIQVLLCQSEAQSLSRRQSPRLLLPSPWELWLLGGSGRACLSRPPADWLPEFFFSMLKKNSLDVLHQYYGFPCSRKTVLISCINTTVTVNSMLRLPALVCKKAQILFGCCIIPFFLSPNKAWLLETEAACFQIIVSPWASEQTLLWSLEAQPWLHYPGSSHLLQREWRP